MFNAKLDGLDGLNKRILSAQKVVQDDISDEMSASVLNIQLDAKRMAPKNLGTLSQSLQIDISQPLSKSVFSTSSYAPYVEFGTGGRVSIPQGWEDEAAQFKGKGSGTMKEFIQALKDWCIRKGIDPKAAYPMAVSILRKGVRPQPFFVPAYEKEKPKLLQRIKALLK